MEKKSDLVVAEVKPITHSSIWPTIKPFVNGGIAGVILTTPACLLHSIYFYSHHLVKSIWGPEFAAKYKAELHSDQSIDAIMKRVPVRLLVETTYRSAQIGSFEILTKRVVAANDGRPLTLYQEACCGLAAGAIGVCIGSPIYSAHFRMQADANLRVAQQLNYRNVFHTLYRTVADRGVFAMWKGAGAFANQTMAISVGMLASYNRSFSYFKESRGLSESSALLCAAAVSGFFASACSLPSVNVYSTMKFMQPDATGKYPYTSFLDCSVKILKSGGPSIFYRGFLKYTAQTSPRVMLTWIVLDKLRKVEESKGF